MQPRVKISLELIKRRITEEITPSEEVIFQLWITQSEDHSQFYNRAEKYFQQGPHYKASPERTKQILRHLEKRLERLNNRRKLIRTYGAAASIAASILIVLSLIFFQNKAPEAVADSALTPGTEKAVLILNNGKEIELDKNKKIKIDKKQSAKVIDNTLKYEDIKTKKITYNTLKVNRGETFSLHLSDGTKVYLNSQTLLRYPVQFSEDSRSVELLEGEAFFEVTKNPSKPFRITSNNQTIEVLGTSFNVSAYSDEDYIQTTLVEGKVKMFNPTSPEKEEILLPNEQITVSKNGGIYLKKTVNTINYTSWKDGVYYFNNASLKDIMKTLSRWYNYEVVFADTTLANVKFGGKFERKENLNNLLDFITTTTDIQFNTENKTIHVK
ncbi:DUF4974 domain-containing protein [Puteibacter caeruleilacunae]|nr:DUF4974 domain-containing protein [Puteibacter caeruleilacunae]